MRTEPILISQSAAIVCTVPDKRKVQGTGAMLTNIHNLAWAFAQWSGDWVWSRESPTNLVTH